MHLPNLTDHPCWTESFIATVKCSSWTWISPVAGSGWGNEKMMYPSEITVYFVSLRDDICTADRASTCHAFSSQWQPCFLPGCKLPNTILHWREKEDQQVKISLAPHQYFGENNSHMDIADKHCNYRE